MRLRLLLFLLLSLLPMNGQRMQRCSTRNRLLTFKAKENGKEKSNEGRTICFLPPSTNNFLLKIFRSVHCLVWIIRTLSTLLDFVKMKNHLLGWWFLSMLLMEPCLRISMVISLVVTFHITNLINISILVADQNCHYYLYYFSVKEDEYLSWRNRTRIIMGIAYCLRYMHHDLNPPVSPPILTSSSIYLTEDYAAKVLTISTQVFCFLLPPSDPKYKITFKIQFGPN